MYLLLANAATPPKVGYFHLEMPNDVPSLLDAAKVHAAAAEIGAREEAIVTDVLAGTSLADARRRHGYHLLQRQETAS